MKISDLQGLGMDNLDAGSAMPIIKILQKTSAEVDETHAKYDTKRVEGAKSGDLYYMADSELLGKEVEFLPLSQSTMYAEWRPQNQGGGLIAHHNQSIITHAEYRKGTGDQQYKEFLGSNELVLTVYFCILFLSTEGTWKQGIVAFTSSNLKHGRALGKQIKTFRYDDPKKKPFIFSRSYMLRTKLVRKASNSWYEFEIVPQRVLDLKEDDALLQQCVSSYEDAVSSMPSITGSQQKLIDADVDSEPF